MNKNIKEKWINALISGDYKQGKLALRQKDEFCCLGVLCDLASKEGIVPLQIYGDNSDKTYSYGFDEHGNQEWQQLPPLVAQWADIDDYSGLYNSDFPSLAEANDDGCTFEEIAVIIKDNF